MAKKIKAFSYLRFSTPEQERGDSFRRQTEAAEKYAKAHGLELDSRTFQDLGVSAYRGANRETGKLGAFLDAVKDGEIPRGSFLLVENLDRLSRDVARKAVRALEDICDEGIKVVTLADGKVYDTKSLDNDPMALMYALMVAMRAHEESEIKSRRLKAAWKQKRSIASTKPMTSKGPAWLHLDKKTGEFQVIGTRATVVRKIFSRTLKGEGQHKIAQHLNETHVPKFGRGDVWHRSYIKKILENPAVIGKFTPHSILYVDGKRTRVPEQEIDGYYPAIISEDDFLAVQSSRDSRKPSHKGKGGRVASFLAGLAKCPLCGSTMTRVNKGSSGGKPYFVCTKAKTGAGCEYKQISQEKIEGALIENAPYFTKLAPSIDRSIDKKVEELEAAISESEEVLRNLVNAISLKPSKRLSDRLAEMEGDFEELKSEYDELLDRQVASSRVLVMKRIGELKEALQGEPLDYNLINSLFRQLLDRVTIDWTTGQLTLTWKHGGENSINYAWPKEGSGS